MSVQHKRTSIKNKPKTVEELTAQGAELERKVSELEQSGGGAVSYTHLTLPTKRIV